MIVCRTVKFKGGSRETKDVIIQQNIVTKGKRRFPFSHKKSKKITINHRPPGREKTESVEKKQSIQQEHYGFRL